VNRLKTFSYFYLFLVLLLAQNFANEPVSYKGRFRPTDTYAKQWLYEIYHKDTLKNEHLQAFQAQTPSALDFVWQLHFFGHKKWEQAPLFWIRQAELKKLLGLNPQQNHFSYQTLHDKIYNDQEINLALMRKLLTTVYGQNLKAPGNRSGKTTLELAPLAPGVWVSHRNHQLTIIESPNSPPWQYLKPGMVIATDIPTANKSLLDEAQSLLSTLSQFAALEGGDLTQESAMQNAYIDLLAKQLAPKEIALNLDQQFPLRSRLQQAGQLLKVLPSRNSPGEWYSLHALHSQIFDPETKQLKLSNNFTAYPDELFYKIRNTYFAWEEAVINGQTEGNQAQEMTRLLYEGYSHIAGKPYKEAAGKQLIYPTAGQLRAESFYTSYPLIIMCIALYAAALLCLLIGWTLEKGLLAATGVIILLCAFAFHTGLLGLRIFILGRAPVSNMFETILYVPWVAVLAGLALRLKYKNPVILIASALASLALLVLLYITHLDNALENVQAVLDSQYWLIIHVLMVVGSYGVFLLCGILGHIYLIGRGIQRKETPGLEFIAKFILQTMYIGVILLVPGTILGGVWAAESWGRFWDWDPKESWAFISICVYLIWIHAYRFHKIGHVGLAIGAVSGFLTISFTWYGVNYILGTGLHSYGFGNGGEGWYYSYLVAEILFLVGVSWRILKQMTPSNT